MRQSLAKWGGLTARRFVPQQAARHPVFATVFATVAPPVCALNRHLGLKAPALAVHIGMPRKSKQAVDTRKGASKPTKRRAASTTAADSVPAQAVAHGLQPQSCGKKRCWPKEVTEEEVGTKKGEVNERMRVYHDERWGRPITDADALFGQVILQSMQSGLSWTTILNKEDNFRSAFANFNIAKVSLFLFRHFPRQR